MPPVRFELAIPTSRLPQNQALDRAVTGINKRKYTLVEISQILGQTEERRERACKKNKNSAQNFQVLDTEVPFKQDMPGVLHVAL